MNRPIHNSNRPNSESRRQRLETGETRKKSAILATLVISFVVVNAATAETTTAKALATVEAEIVGRRITWRVTNHGDVPIVRVKIPTFRTYDHVVPDHWEFQDSIFSMHAWARDEQAGIRKNLSREFHLTGGASGCKPGLTVVELTLADDRVVHVENVVTFQEETWTTTALPPVLVAVLVFILVLRHRRKRSQQQQP